MKQLDRSSDPATDTVISAALEVHRRLGPGLLESAYAECLAREFTLRGIPFLREMPLHIDYKGARVPVVAYRLDFVVCDSVVVEVKAQDRLVPLYQAQLLTYLRLGRYSRGLLLNFGTPRLIDGIKRVVNEWVPSDAAPDVP